MMDDAEMKRALADAAADLERGERGVAEALALPWDAPDLRIERNHALSHALGRQAEICGRVRKVNAAVRKEIERTPA